MKFEEFKSGKYRQQYQYKSFLPAKINHEWTWDDPRINVLLEKANRALGELNAFTLITLYLVNHGLLAKPSLYLSDHLEKQRGAYYDSLTRVRESNDMGHWCRFFLKGVSETAENGKRTFQKILSLRQDIERRIVTLGRRAENGRKLILHLYEHPAVSIRQIMDVLGIQFNPARSLVASFMDMGILKEITGQRRNRLFLFEPYFKIFADRESEI